jgi:hypothetical protein
MTNIDDIWQELENKDKAWEIEGNPFTEASIDIDRLRQVFTCRDEEIKTVIQQLRSVNRSMISINKIQPLLESYFSMPKECSRAKLLLSLRDILWVLLTKFF